MNFRGCLSLGLARATVVLIAAVSVMALVLGSECVDARPRSTMDTGDIERAVRAVLDAQVAAWNRGDIDGFMDGYARLDSTRFASGGTVVRGWQTVHDRYKKSYDTREKMGQLTFSDLEVSVLSPDSAIVFGHWQLARSGDAPGGLFTLLFARTKDGWRIVADHTSAGEAPKQ
jgi:uncharacterized protein (TIGR02246 family)